MYHIDIEGVSNWKLLHKIGSLDKWTIQLRNGRIIHAYIEGLYQGRSGFFYLERSSILNPDIRMRDIVYARCGIWKIIDRRMTNVDYVMPKMIEGPRKPGLLERLSLWVKS